MKKLTLADRVASYSQRFPECPNAMWVAGDKQQWLYGVWQLGQYWKNASRYYGAYPHSFLERVAALFPEIPAHEVLHVFSGSMSAGEYTRPELVGSVYDIKKLTARRFSLVIADPPYSAEDAKHYGTAGIDRGKATRALADVVVRGGQLVWLDTTWPMYRKDLWHYYGAIELRRSTNQRLRGVSIFQRKAA